MTEELELVVDAKATLGEGPAWDIRRQLLIWVDIMEKRVHEYDPKTNENRTSAFEQYVGAAVPAEDGNMLLAMHHGFHRWNRATGEVELLADPERQSAVNRFNDGKCDPGGRFWAGTMGLNGEEGTGALYRLDPDGSVRTILEGITCSNGLAWSPDARTMYYIDTGTRCVRAFDYDVETGDIRNGRTTIEVPKQEGKPDGMTIDEEGMLWVAHWGGSQVIRWNPHNGAALRRIAVPAARTTSCAFGGERLDELYITSARIGLSAEELAPTSHAGGVFRLKLDVKGTPIAYGKLGA